MLPKEIREVKQGRDITPMALRRKIQIDSFPDQTNSQAGAVFVPYMVGTSPPFQEEKWVEKFDTKPQIKLGNKLFNSSCPQFPSVT